MLWLGSASTPTPDAVLARSDVHDVQFAVDRDRHLLARYLASRLPRIRGPLYVLRAQQLPGDLDGLDLDRLRPRLQVDVESLRPAMDEARLIKDEYEVAMIRRANQVSSRAHRAVARALSEGRCVNECQIEAVFVNSVGDFRRVFCFFFFVLQGVKYDPSRQGCLPVDICHSAFLTPLSGKDEAVHQPILPHLVSTTPDMLSKTAQHYDYITA